MRIVEKEALIMERRTESNLIVDIYGHCGTSITAEAMPGEVEPIIVPAPEDGDFDSYDRGHLHQTDLDAKQHASHEQSDHHGKSPEIAMLMAESMAE
jgi:hypothetical protein